MQNSNDKTLIAKCLNIERENIYYDKRRDKLDEEVKNQIETVQVDNPAYGHRRIAIELLMNKKKILRIMKKYGIKPLRRKVKLFKKQDCKSPTIAYINVMKLLCPVVANYIWVSDFTYIRYKGRFIYLAVVQDLLTKEVLGVAISRFHNKNLVIEALQNAIERTGTTPVYIHSDQGSEYRSEAYWKLCEKNGIIISMSDKGSPWQNGQMESFFGKFKAESGDLERFETLPELIEYIYKQVYYYNNQRIHTKLKMCPVKFREKQCRTLSELRGI